MLVLAGGENGPNQNKDVNIHRYNIIEKKGNRLKQIYTSTNFSKYKLSKCEHFQNTME